MNLDYLTDDERDALRALAREYATNCDWPAGLVAKYGDYHVNRNEVCRSSISTTAAGFRILHPDLP
jgi:hypothetical protein